MARTFRLTAVGLALALVATACGSGAGQTNAHGGALRKVLVDYKHDAFVSSFLKYYPTNVVVHPGDTVSFDVTWSGEPHSVTMGQEIDEFFKYRPIFDKYNSKEEALAAGEKPEFIDQLSKTISRVPGMTDNGVSIYEPGARPCFIPKLEDIPAYSDDNGNTNKSPDIRCPTEGKPQPEFTGTQGLYNSGFIPFQGPSANKFVVPIAKTAVPGTYTYFCNYHWIDMHGTVKIVPKSAPIPSQDAVTRQARQEIDRDAKLALSKVAKVAKGDFGKVKPPLAGLETLPPDAHMEAPVLVNEFLPAKVTATVGKPKTWTVQGTAHTVSFNVPKYFPVFTITKSRDVLRDPKSQEAVAWTVPPPPEDNHDGPPPPPRTIDVGSWDGKGGFHSSGILGPGDTFTVTFTKPGTYPYACVIHPLMIGTVTVSA